MFFSKILSSLTRRSPGIASMAPRVFNLAASAHSSCNWYLGKSHSSGMSPSVGRGKKELITRTVNKILNRKSSSTSVVYKVFVVDYFEDCID